MDLTSHPPTTGARVLLTGASGYIGGRLLSELQAKGYAVRCMARRPDFLHDRVPSGTEVIQGDVLDPESLRAALDGVEAAYYLVHSMGSRESFENLDREGAENFARAAAAAGVKRIIYLGGLGDASETLSPHLRSRHETGMCLRSAGVPVIEFRASIVIGSGSLSFEMIRNLVERLPVMTAPKWVQVKAQPIFITDLLKYLVAGLEIPLEDHRIFEIGGADVVSYAGLMQEYARQRKLRRLLIPVPVLSPGISSLWLGLVTPLYARIGRKLIDSVRHPTVVNDPSAREFFAIEPVGVQEAIAQALRNEDRRMMETHWSDAQSSAIAHGRESKQTFGNRLVDHRTREVSVEPEKAFRPIQTIGGARGWYFANFLWRLRGLVDLWLGGVGMRRGRRDPEQLRVGDIIDWWRVEQFEPGKKLTLVAEMKLPGRAWLSFEVNAVPTGARIEQVAIFDPVGVGGRLYWYGIYPVHALVFRGMLRGIAREAMRA